MYNNNSYITRRINSIIFKELLYNKKINLRGDPSMWVVTVFEENSIRIFEFADKSEASMLMESYNGSAILSFTN